MCRRVRWQTWAIWPQEAVVGRFGASDYSLLQHRYSLFSFVALPRFSKEEPGGRLARQMERNMDDLAAASADRKDCIARKAGNRGWFPDGIVASLSPVRAFDGTDGTAGTGEKFRV